MCRLLTFNGSCTRCGETQTWEDLSQQLSCLEAKNNGSFGECESGVFIEQHDFDQECDTCAEEDEGLGDVGDQEMTTASSAKRAADPGEANGTRKKQKT
ncbi:hypothetical protein CDD83_1345 [Cordyceps sp. RAO-2017]|nr:hypothetical protein CDD83_1345 [Cordyceps sp. RAO-2017]